MRQIRILESYPFFGQNLHSGAVYTVGQMVHGHVLDEERADRLIAEGWAEEWGVRYARRS